MIKAVYACGCFKLPCGNAQLFVFTVLFFFFLLYFSNTIDFGKTFPENKVVSCSSLKFCLFDPFVPPCVPFLTE